tara:strand:+ start:166 stop:528 length:363 start_codon:yes stop_codon:yes gene_type:complete
MRRVNSETPIRYATYSPTQYFTHEPGQLDTRPALTRMNELDYPSTYLGGTAPYHLQKGAAPYVHKESELIHGDYSMKTRFDTEEHLYFQNNVVHPNHIEAKIPVNTLGISTRNVYRNVKF